MAENRTTRLKDMLKNEFYELGLLKVCMLSALCSMPKLGGPEGLGEILKLYTNVQVKICQRNSFPFIIVYKCGEITNGYAFL